MKIFVGWDSRQEIAYEVCVSSIQRYLRRPVEIVPLEQEELRAAGLYWREEDPLASTEFTYTRFLVPTLSRFSGWALFLDSDFLFTADVWELLEQADDRYALMCVKHDYRPTEKTKMDGAAQSVYPRKNWSSLVLWNCGHPANAEIRPEVVNSQSGAFLHRFQWLDDALIGEIPGEWNWLEGWNRVPDEGLPKAIHFTRGGPWFDDWQDVDFADLWREERRRLEEETRSSG